MAKFSLGEIVQLRSGGPTMTVIAIIEKGNPGAWAMHVRRWLQENPNAEVWYKTKWFEGTNLKEDIFIENSLDSAE